MGPRGTRIGTGEGSSMRNFIVSPSSRGIIKSRKTRWAGHVARMEEERSTFKFLTGKTTFRKA